MTLPEEPLEGIWHIPEAYPRRPHALTASFAPPYKASRFSDLPKTREEAFQLLMEWARLISENGFAEE